MFMDESVAHLSVYVGYFLHLNSSLNVCFAHISECLYLKLLVCDSYISTHAYSLKPWTNGQIHELFEHGFCIKILKKQTTTCLHDLTQGSYRQG